MEIKVRKTRYPEGFAERIDRAIRKGASSVVTQVEDMVFVSCYANKRPAGRFKFLVIEGSCVLQEKMVIEIDFYPLEIAVHGLVKYFKRKKVRIIVI